MKKENQEKKVKHEKEMRNNYSICVFDDAWWFVTNGNCCVHHFLILLLAML